MTNKILYHYTSMGTLYNILGVEEDKICFRATHANFLNDPQEYECAMSIIEESMIEYENKHNITSRKSSSLFKKNNFFSKLPFMGGEPYILSFSEKDDDLTMWRAYGKDGTGVCIGLDLDMLKDYCQENNNINSNILKCEYDHDKLILPLIEYWELNYDKIIIDDATGKISLNNFDLLFSINKLCFKAKHNSFKIEKEWRLCRNESVEKNTKFKVNKNIIVPFVEHHFDKNIIKKIVIGPSLNNEQAEKALVLFLKRFNYKEYNNLVKTSKLSYRLV